MKRDFLFVILPPLLYFILFAGWTFAPACNWHGMQLPATVCDDVDRGDI